MRYLVQLELIVGVTTPKVKIQSPCISLVDMRGMNISNGPGMLSFVVDVPEGCPRMLSFSLIEADGHETHYSSVFLCQNISDCDACNSCLGGICVKLCPEDKICNEVINECVECIVAEDCNHPNKECVEGKCVDIHTGPIVIPVHYRDCIDQFFKTLKEE